jgi:hypothetical protein
MAEPVDVGTLRERVRERLQRSGVLDSLQAQLRFRVLQELKSSWTPAPPKHVSAKTRAFDAIVADYLKRFGHTFALSVFLAESGSAPDQYCDEDISTILDVSLQGEDSILQQLIASVVLRSSLVSSGCQTDESLSDDRLEVQLKQLETQYREQKERIEVPSEAVEERMIKYRRECDQRAAEELKLEIERVRSMEVAQARLEESERYREEVVLAREKMERAFQDRVQRLREREEQIENALRERHREMEAHEFQRRQQLLGEIESLRLRELELKVGTSLA